MTKSIFFRGILIVVLLLLTVLALRSYMHYQKKQAILRDDLAYYAGEMQSTCENSELIRHYNIIKKPFYYNTTLDTTEPDSEMPDWNIADSYFALKALSRQKQFKNIAENAINKAMTNYSELLKVLMVRKEMIEYKYCIEPLFNMDSIFIKNTEIKDLHQKIIASDYAYYNYNTFDFNELHTNPILAFYESNKECMPCKLKLPSSFFLNYFLVSWEEFACLYALETKDSFFLKYFGITDYSFELDGTSYFARLDRMDERDSFLDSRLKHIDFKFEYSPLAPVLTRNRDGCKEIAVLMPSIDAGSFGFLAIHTDKGKMVDKFDLQKYDNIRISKELVKSWIEKHPKQKFVIKIYKNNTDSRLIKASQPLSFSADLDLLIWLYDDLEDYRLLRSRWNNFFRKK